MSLRGPAAIATISAILVACAQTGPPAQGKTKLVHVPEAPSKAQPDSAEEPSPPSETDCSLPEGVHGSLPRITTLEDVKQHVGKTATIVGRYEVDPVPRGKGLQAACIVLADRKRLIRSYRPVPAEVPFHNHCVVVIGKAYLDANLPPDQQQVMAPHVFPDKVVLAGSKPAPPPMSEIPTPPTVESRHDLVRQEDRYVQVYATVDSVVPEEENANFGVATIRLADRSLVDAPFVWVGRWKPHIGKEVSVIGLVQASRGERGRPVLVTAPVLCPGRVERCGMDGKGRP